MKYVVSLLAAVVFAGCGSMSVAPRSASASLEGVVFTAGGAPLRGASITLNDDITVSSDADGRFTFARVGTGAHRVHARRESYEDVTLTIAFSRPTDILYLQMFSADELVRAASQALERDRTSDAEHLIDRALALDPESVRARYLAAIVYARTGRSREARAVLGALADESTSNAVDLLLERIAEEESK